MAKEVNVHSLGLQGKNEFLDKINILSYRYDTVLQDLGLNDYENLVELARNKVYEYQEYYSVEDEYYFYCSLSGDIIIQMFVSMLETEYDKLLKASSKVKNYSFIELLIYDYLIPEKWLVEYYNLCDFFKNFHVEQVKEEYFKAFVDCINDDEFKGRREDYIRSFKIELQYLTGDDKLSNEIDKRLVKSIGGIE